MHLPSRTVTLDGSTCDLTHTEFEILAYLMQNKGLVVTREQLITKIWDRFYRGESSRDRKTGGTGLGLAISKQILELHQVPYGVTNTEDGVEFYFSLNKTKEP